MTDHVVKSNEYNVSQFIIGTCQLIPKSCDPTSDHTVSLAVSSDTATAILSGSQAEFYIRPLNTCIGDCDIMMRRVDELAYVGDVPMLPSDRTGLPERIRCYKIVSSHKYPGFIRLRKLGEMNYNWKHERYEFNKIAEPEIYAAITKRNPVHPKLDQTLCDLYKSTKLSRTLTGPAIKTKTDSAVFSGHDLVISVFC